MFKTSDYGIKTLITILQEEIDRNGEEYPDINVVCKDIIKQNQLCSRQSAIT